MNHYMDEEVMWQRLQDLQREAENRRLFTQYTLPAVVRQVGLLGRRAWWLAGLAIQRPPRRSPLRVVRGEKDARRDAA